MSEPWRIHEADGGTSLLIVIDDDPADFLDGNGAPIEYEPHFMTLAEVYVYHDSEQECRERASLLAAAPAMREALRGLANYAPPGTADTDRCWCPEAWFGPVGSLHAPECIDARAALADAEPPGGRGTGESEP